MVIDSSALVAILFKEPEMRSFAYAIQNASIRLISACTFFETSIKLERSKPSTVHELDALIAERILEIVPFDTQQLRIARMAYATFGKGHHKAGLNMGDCFSYALAKSKNLPLLFKGNDFIYTDITPAFSG